MNNEILHYLCEDNQIFIQLVTNKQAVYNIGSTIRNFRIFTIYNDHLIAAESVKIVVIYVSYFANSPWMDVIFNKVGVLFVLAVRCTVL